MLHRSDLPDPIPDERLLLLCTPRQVQVWRAMRYLQRRSLQPSPTPPTRKAIVEVIGGTIQALTPHLAALYRAGLIEAPSFGRSRYLAVLPQELPVFDAGADDEAEPPVLVRCTSRQAAIWRAMRQLQRQVSPPMPVSRSLIQERVAVSRTVLGDDIRALHRLGLLSAHPGRCRYLAILPNRGDAPLAGDDAPLDEPFEGDDDLGELDEIVLDAPPLVEGFTERQRQVWSAMRQFQAQYGTAAPVSTLARFLGYRHSSAVLHHFPRLAASGYLRHEGRAWIAVRKDQ